MKKPPAVSTFEIHWKPVFRAIIFMVLAYFTALGAGWVIDRLPSSVQGVLGIVLVLAIFHWLYRAYLDAEKKKEAKAKKVEDANRLFGANKLTGNQGAQGPTQ